MMPAQTDPAFRGMANETITQQSRDPAEAVAGAAGAAEGVVRGSLRPGSSRAMKHASDRTLDEIEPLLRDARRPARVPERR